MCHCVVASDRLGLPYFGLATQNLIIMLYIDWNGNLLCTTSTFHVVDVKLYMCHMEFLPSTSRMCDFLPYSLISAEFEQSSINFVPVEGVVFFLWKSSHERMTMLINCVPFVCRSLSLSTLSLLQFQ